jgi:hypothetical protein
MGRVAFPPTFTPRSNAAHLGIAFSLVQIKIKVRQFVGHRKAEAKRNRPSVPYPSVVATLALGGVAGMLTAGLVWKPLSRSVV